VHIGPCATKNNDTSPKLALGVDFVIHSLTLKLELWTMIGKQAKSNTVQEILGMFVVVMAMQVQHIQWIAVLEPKLQFRQITRLIMKEDIE
jgi:hypothetical protein